MLTTTLKPLCSLWLIALLLVFMRAGVCVTPEVESDKALPKSGNLATSSVSGAASAAIPDPFGEVDPSGRQISPITGSVSRSNADQWIVKIFNNSKQEYAVTVDVVQRAGRSGDGAYGALGGSEVRRDSFSLTLKSGSFSERRVPAGVGAKEVELNLRSWKNLSKREQRAGTVPSDHQE
jgi:hypothetical protein